MESQGSGQLLRGPLDAYASVVAGDRSSSHSPSNGRFCKARRHRIFACAHDMARMRLARACASLRIATCCLLGKISRKFRRRSGWAEIAGTVRRGSYSSQERPRDTLKSFRYKSPENCQLTVLFPSFFRLIHVQAFFFEKLEIAVMMYACEAGIAGNADDVDDASVIPSSCSGSFSFNLLTARDIDSRPYHFTQGTLIFSSWLKVCCLDTPGCPVHLWSAPQ